MLRELWSLVRPLVLVGWVVAGIRYVLEWTAPGMSMWFGVYYVVIPLLAYFAVTRRFDRCAWPKAALAMVLLAVLVWGLPNLIAYATAQFQGWTHGRFAEGRGPKPQDSTPMKLLVSLGVAGGTTVAAAVLSIVVVTLFGWVPKRLRARRTLA